MSTAGLLAAATDRLAAAGIRSPRYDAERLAVYALGGSRTALAATTVLPPAAVDRLAVLVERRATREPLQYIVGSAPFRRLELAVGPGVFIPRPETEVLVSITLERLPARPVVVDLCAGSGAIGLAVATECPGARVHLVERSPAAFAWLTRNAACHDVALQLAGIDGVSTGALSALRGTVDAVLANPPYLVDGVREALEPEVAGHDPAEALFAGPDGLDVIRVVIAEATNLLRPGGLLVVEHGDDQGPAVRALVGAGGFTGVTGHSDLTGAERFVSGVAR